MFSTLRWPLFRTIFCLRWVCRSEQTTICFSKWRSSVLGWWNITITVMCVYICVYLLRSGVAFKQINWIWNHPIWKPATWNPCIINKPRFSFSFQLSKPTLKEVQGVGRVRGEKKPVLADAPWRKSDVERMVKRCGTGFLGMRHLYRSHTQWK